MDQPTNIPDILEDIFFIDANNGWVVGENGIILHTTNGGDSWGIQTSGTEEKLLSVSFADSAVGWIVGGGLRVLVHYPAYNQWWRNMGRRRASR